MVNEGDPTTRIGREVSGVTPKQRAAMRKVDELTERILADGRAQPIVELYRQSIVEGGRLLNEAEIAEEVLPEEFAARRGIARQAVDKVVHAAIPPNERVAIAARRRTLFSQRTLEDHGKKIHSAGGKASAEATQRGERKMPVYGTPWSSDEIDLVVTLADASRFKHTQGGPHNGMPDWKRITDFINRMSPGSAARSVKSVRNAYYEERKPRG